MAQLHRTLLDSDLREFIQNDRTRCDWIKTWRETIEHLRSSRNGDSTKEQRNLELIYIVSHNQHTVTKQMLGLDEDLGREIEQLQHYLNDLQVKKIDGNDLSVESLPERYDAVKLAINGMERHRYSPSFAAIEADDHLRDWYLSNITLPYPDKPAKQHLASLTGMEPRQLNTWFTNMRRRSGYTDLMRKCADGDKELFEKLCQQADGGEGPEGLSEALQEMRRYVGRKPKGEVGDWLVNVSHSSP